MQGAFAKWGTSVHRAVGCHACHTQSTRESLERLYQYVTLRPTEVTRHAEVDFVRCGACHLSRDPRWKQVANTAGHEVHFARLGFQCVQCHSPGNGAMTALHCTACHAFLATDRALADPQRADCLGCHDCQRSHHLQDFGLHAVPAHGDCQSCHQPHLWRVDARARCERCHDDRPDHNADLPCAGCHGCGHPGAPAPRGPTHGPREEHDS